LAHSVYLQILAMISADDVCRLSVNEPVDGHVCRSAALPVCCAAKSPISYSIVSERPTYPLHSHTLLQGGVLSLFSRPDPQLPLTKISRGNSTVTIWKPCEPRDSMVYISNLRMESHGYTR